MLISSSVQISTNDSSTYFAGVVEYLVNQGEIKPAPEQFKQNAEKYIEIINSEKAGNVDIIVFPEACLNSRETAVIVPRETEDIDLCANDTYDQNLKDISCAAKNSNKYVVVNLYMKRNCSEEHARQHDDEHECKSEWLLYNTNVVFDRKGKVISIYRKYNLFGEPGITQPDSPDISKFSTDFGVTFGHFICFDLMFEKPALELVAQGVTDIVFPTMWFSELPFLTAVQIQQNWAHSNDVNFLGAGANQPKVGSGGSGIYSGKYGALISTMTGEEVTKLLVHEVPKIPGNVNRTSGSAYSGSNFGNLKLKRDQLDVYEKRRIELQESETSHSENFTLCQKFENDNLCCDFNITVTLQLVPENSVSYSYYAVVFNGNRTFDGVADGHIRTCAVLACQNETIASCGKMYQSNESVHSNIKFEKIEISGSFPVEHVLTLPNSLNFDVSPYPTSDFSYEEKVNQQSTSKDITISLLTPKADVYTFAIYARDFRSSSGNKLTSTIVVLLAVFVSKFLIH